MKTTETVDPGHQHRGPSGARRGEVLEMVRQELGRQDEKWGADRNLSLRTWLSILMEEVGEVARASLESEPTDRVVEELAEVAAVACAAIENAKRFAAWPEESRLPIPQVEQP